MTDDEALALRPGDRILLRRAPGQPPPQRDIFTVLRVEMVRGEAEIISTDLIRFVPWEVEKVEPERRP